MTEVAATRHVLGPSADMLKMRMNAAVVVIAANADADHVVNVKSNHITKKLLN